jgi:hypothetical protein
MKSNNSQSESTAAQELQRRVNERFGVLPNFLRLSPETPRSLKNCGDLPKLRISTIPYPLCLRNDFSSIFLAFAQSVTASPGAQVS